jgi:hypothetical protein
MLSLHEIVSHMSAEEREKFKEQIEATRRVEIELHGIQARSLQAASELNGRLTKISESFQSMAQSMTKLKKDIECSQQAAKETLSEVQARRDSDLQACLARIPTKSLARA